MSAANFYKPGRGKKAMTMNYSGGNAAPKSSGGSSDITGGTPKTAPTTVNPQSHAPHMNAATTKIVTFKTRSGKTVTFKRNLQKKKKPKRTYDQ